MKEIPVLLRVRNIHENAHQLVAIHLPCVLPLAFYPLSFRGDSAKLATKFNERIGNEVIWHRTAIVKPKREQNLESPAGSAHRSLALEL
jgi:hypothetical protein